MSMDRPAGAMTPGQWIGRAVAILILTVFVLFFVVPLIWLVLAPTKTDRNCCSKRPSPLATGTRSSPTGTRW